MPFTKLHAALLRARLLAGEDPEDLAAEEDVPVKDIEKLVKKDGGKPQDVAVMRSDLVDPPSHIKFLYFSDGKIYQSEEGRKIYYSEWDRSLDASHSLEKKNEIKLRDLMYTYKFKDRKLRNAMYDYLLAYSRWRESKK